MRAMVAAAVVALLLVAPAPSDAFFHGPGDAGRGMIDSCGDSCPALNKQCGHCPALRQQCDQMLRCQCHEVPTATGGCAPMDAYSSTLSSEDDVKLFMQYTFMGFNSVARQVVAAVKICIPMGGLSFKAASYVNRAAMCLNLSRDRLSFKEYLLVSDVLSEGIAQLGRLSLDFGATPDQADKQPADADVLASAAKARLLSQLARDAVPDSAQAIPVFTGKFWQDNGGFVRLGEKLDAYIKQYDGLLSERRSVNFTRKVFLEPFLDISKNELLPAEATLEKNSMSCAALLEVARKNNARMQEAQEPLPAMLDKVNTDCKAKIEAVKEFEQKEVQVKRAHAIFNLVKSTLSLAANVLTAGASSAVKLTEFYNRATAAEAKGSRVKWRSLPGLFRTQVIKDFKNISGEMWKKAKEKGNKCVEDFRNNSDLDEAVFNETGARSMTRLACRVNETKDLVANGQEMVGKLEEALQGAAGDPMHEALAVLKVAGGPLGDVADIASALSVFTNEQQELEKIDNEAKDSHEKLDRAISLAQDHLSRLMEQAASISLTMLKTVEWMSGDAVTIADTTIPDNLFEAPEVWTVTVEQIIAILEDNEACPDQAEPNPFNAPRLLLSASARPELLQLRGGAPSTSSGDARLLQLYERAAATSPVDAAEFRRTLLFKPSSEAERQAASDAFEKLRGSCGQLAEQLKKFAMWGQISHKALFDAVNGIRNVLEGRISLNTANANLKVAQNTIELVKSEVDQSFTAEFLLAGSGEVLEQGAASAIEALCRAFRYAQPTSILDDVVGSTTYATASLDMAACKVQIAGTARAPSMLERVQALRTLITAADEPLRRAGLAMNEGPSGPTIGERIEYVASCELKSTSFAEELLAKPSRPTQFDVRFSSFAGKGKESTACQDNAEFNSMLVVFRDASGNVVPDPVTHPNLRIEVAVEPVRQRTMFKYMHGKDGNQTRWRELAYELQGKYGFSVSYFTVKDGADCDKSQNKEVLTRAGRSDSFCVQRASTVDQQPFSRLPVFGTWQVTLMSDWPAGVPVPASVEIKINHFASGLQGCAKEASSASIVSTTTERRRRSGVSTRATMIGANICGGRPQVRVGQAAATDDAGANAGAVIVALLILATVPATVWYLRRRDAEREGRRRDAEREGRRAVDISAFRGAARDPAATDVFKEPPALPNRLGSLSPRFEPNPRFSFF